MYDPFSISLSLICCICSCMIAIGGILVKRSQDEKREKTVDYFLYVFLLISIISVICAILIPVLIGYKLLNFFGIV